MQHSIPLLNPPTDIGLAIAFGSIETYLDAARRQQQRIRRARSTLLTRSRSGRLFDAIEVLAIKDTKRLGYLLERAQSDIQIRKIIKATRAE